jgi:hypothetical protein
MQLILAFGRCHSHGNDVHISADAKYISGRDRKIWPAMVGDCHQHSKPWVGGQSPVGLCNSYWPLEDVKAMAMMSTSQQMQNIYQAGTERYGLLWLVIATNTPDLR